MSAELEMAEGRLLVAVGELLSAIEADGTDLAAQYPEEHERVRMALDKAWRLRFEQDLLSGEG